MPKVAKPLPILTDEQKGLLESRWYEPADVLLKLLWPDKSLNMRHIEYKAIRSYLSTIGKVPNGGPGSGSPPPAFIPAPPPASAVPPIALSLPADPAASPVEPVAPAAPAAFTPPLPAGLSLTTSQQEFITASYKDSSGPVELARSLFNDQRIMGGDARTRLVIAFIRKIDPGWRREDEMAEDVDYQPPKTQQILIGRLNRYGIGGRQDGRKLGDGPLTGQEEKQVTALLAALRKSIFKVEADKFTRKIDRDVFEETFLATCWDKPDLSPEHLIQFVQLASLTAQRNITDRMMRTLDERFTVGLEDPTQRLAKTEVEALKELKAAASEHLKQINTLIRTLTGERRNMLEKEQANSASLHPLVTAWRTKEGRARIMAVAAKYRDDLKGEIGRLSEMDQLKCDVFGLSAEQILK